MYELVRLLASTCMYYHLCCILRARRVVRSYAYNNQSYLRTIISAHCLIPMSASKHTYTVTRVPCRHERFPYPVPDLTPPILLPVSFLRRPFQSFSKSYRIHPSTMYQRISRIYEHHLFNRYTLSYTTVCKQTHVYVTHVHHAVTTGSHIPRQT